MSRKFIFLISAFTMAAGLIYADVTPMIDFSLDKEGQKWREAYRNQGKEESIVEYVHADQSLNNWTELFTLQFFQNYPETAKQFYDHFITLLKDKTSPHQLESKVLKEDNDSILAEWWVKDKGQLDQHELVRIIKKGNQLVVAHFVTKKTDQIDSLRSKWQDILGNIKFDKERYTNDGYSFVLPSDWYVNQTKFNDTEKKSFEDPSHQISLLDAEIVHFTNKNPEEFLKEASADDNLWGTFDKFETIKLDNGQEVKLLVFKPRLKYRDFETVSVLAPIIKGDRLFLMVATMPSKSYSDSRSQVDSIIKSFKTEG